MELVRFLIFSARGNALPVCLTALPDCASLHVVANRLCPDNETAPTLQLDTTAAIHTNGFQVFAVIPCWKTTARTTSDAHFLSVPLVCNNAACLHLKGSLGKQARYAANRPTVILASKSATGICRSALEEDVEITRHSNGEARRRE